MANVRLKLLSGNNSAYIVVDSAITAVVGDKIIAKKSGITVTLPSALKFGDKVYVKNIGTGSITVERGGTAVIDSARVESFSVATNKTYLFEAISADIWSVTEITAVDELQVNKLGEAIAYVNLAPGVKVKIQETADLK